VPRVTCVQRLRNKILGLWERLTHAPYGSLAPSTNLASSGRSATPEFSDVSSPRSVTPEQDLDQSNGYSWHYSPSLSIISERSENESRSTSQTLTVRTILELERPSCQISASSGRSGMPRSWRQRVTHAARRIRPDACQAMQGKVPCGDRAPDGMHADRRPSWYKAPMSLSERICHG
jgi:hypothetical protein